MIKELATCGLVLLATLLPGQGSFCAEQPVRTLTVDQPARQLDSNGWTPLFNGLDLTNWICHLQKVGDDDPSRVFQVYDGLIHVYKDHPQGSLVPKGYFSTKREYSHFHLRFQYRWLAKKFQPRLELPKDAGVMYHVVGPDRLWPQSIECQVQEGDTGDCLTVGGTGLTTTVDRSAPGRYEHAFRFTDEGGIERQFGAVRNLRFIKSGEHEVDGWNTVDVIVRGDREAIHMVNGNVVFHAKDLRQLGPDKKTWYPLSHGRIVFQAECAEVQYRDIRIRPLSDGPLHPKPRETALALPAGLEAVEVAGPPLVEYPTLACFDDRGRLYVSEGGNVNDPYDVLVKTLPRSIRRLEDVDGDGVFDRATVFADKMTFPYGGVWHDGALYVASDPSIWRLEDTDGDGVADKREEVISGFGSEGHSSSVKGGYLGRDGWLYFAGGNERGGYDLKGSDGRRLRDPNVAPCVFRMKPDGSNLEFFANGAAGIYDLCFDRSGDLFGVVTILRYPRGDGLMHWLYGGAYETSRSQSRYARLTGGRLPPLREWAQTSPSGLALYESSALGEEFRGNLFAAHFNTHVVTRSVVERDGGSWRVAHEEDFIRSSDTNCRFTDVLEDADGSLLVVNTGGWFRIGCPTSQVGEGALTGAIYRIRRSGFRGPEDPRGLRIAWTSITADELGELLCDERPVVRERAITELARRGKSSLRVLRGALDSPSPSKRQNAVWALTRIDDPQARDAVRLALSDSDLTTSMAAIHSAGLWRDRDAAAALLELVKSDSPAIVRQSAAALGRLGDRAAVPALLDALAEATDRWVEHAIIYALIELDAPEPTLAGLGHRNAAIARGALIALDQMPSGRLRESDVAPLLASPDENLQRTALDVASRRRGWSKGIVELLAKWLAEPAPDGQRQAALSEALINFRGVPQVQELIGRTLADPSSSPAMRRRLLEVMARSRLRKLPAAWRNPLADCLLAGDQELAATAISTISAIGRGQFDATLRALALDEQRPTQVRLAAAAAMLAAGRSPDSDVFRLLISRCADEETEPVTRLTVAKALGEARLSADQLQQMTELVAMAGPLELPSLLRAYEESPDPVAGEELFRALAESPGVSNISATRLQRLVARYPDSVHGLASDLIERLQAEMQSESLRMDELRFALEGGDPDRGRLVFYGKSACSQCHRVNRQGSGIGPDLSHIGEIRTRRDLLEAIVSPSATLARGYESVNIITKSGKTLTGILRSETGAEVFLLTADRSETAVPRDEIDDIIPSRVSIMPQGLDRNLKPEELRDLLAFLESLRS